MEIVLGKMAGFCGGVRNAVNKTYKEAESNNKTIYCLGDLVHNPVVLSNLEALGVKIINSLEEVPNSNGKTVIIRAHGVTKEIYNKAKQMEITLKDLTCPKVLKIHDFVEEYAKNEDYIFLIGEKKHPEVIGTASFCGRNSTIIENEEELDEALKIIKKECEEKNKKNIYNIETKKDKLCINQIIGTKNESFEVEGDAIIPDIKPDILKVINTSGNVCIYKKEVLDGKVRIDGCINVNMMYLADNEEGNVRGLTSTIDFTKVIEIKEAKSEMLLECKFVLKEIECKILNGRKVSFKSLLDVNIKVSSNEEVEFIEAISKVEDIQILNKNFNINSLVGSRYYKSFGQGYCCN